MRKKLIWSVFTSFLLANVAFAQPGKQAKAPANVVVSRVVKIVRAGNETFVGTLNSSRKSILGSAVDGRVVNVFVDAGDPISGVMTTQGGKTVFEGEPLVQLRTDSLEIEMGAARIQLELAEHTLDELRTTLPSDQELAESKSKESHARYSFSEAEFGRLSQMSDTGVSQAEIDAARSQFEVNKQLAVSANVQLKRFNALRNIRLDKAKSLVAAMKQEVARLDDLLKKYTIRAPFDGFVISKTTEIGTWATKGMPLLEVVKLDRMQFVVNVPQAYIGRLQESLMAHTDVSKNAMAVIQFEGIEQPIEGHIVRIVPQADLNTRTFPVRIDILNPKMGDGFLLQPGMMGRASMSIGTPKEMLMVKKDTLVLGGGQPAVLKIQKRGGQTVATKVSVLTGQNIGDWIQITGDVRENDQIVIQGNERLRPGQAVMISATDSSIVPIE